MFVTRNEESLNVKARQPSGQPTAAPAIPCLAHDQLAATFRRLTYEVSGDPNAARVLICEHPPSVTVGRHGSIADVRDFPRNSVHYVGRGGKALPHGPGQLGIHPVFPLDHWRIAATEHVAKLLRVARAIARRYDVATEVDPEEAIVAVGSRVLAAVGVAIHRGVSRYGIAFNANPDLELFTAVRVNGSAMTSLVRESPFRVLLHEIPRVALEAIADEYPEFRNRNHSIGFDATC